MSRYSRTGCKILLAPLALLLGTSQSVAHHSFAPYDIRNPVEIEGVATSFQYTQPHARLLLEDKEGVVWDIEIPNRRWQRQGIPQDAIEEGDELVVKMFPARNGSPEAAISGFSKEGTYYNVTEEIRQRSATEAADAIEAGEDPEEVLERYERSE